MGSTVIIVVFVAVAVGLLVGRALYVLTLTVRTHNPDCPHAPDVIARARRAQLDVDELTRSKEGQYG